MITFVLLLLLLSFINQAHNLLFFSVEQKLEKKHQDFTGSKKSICQHVFMYIVKNWIIMYHTFWFTQIWKCWFYAFLGNNVNPQSQPGEHKGIFIRSVHETSPITLHQDQSGHVMASTDMCCRKMWRPGELWPNQPEPSHLSDYLSDCGNCCRCSGVRGVRGVRGRHSLCLISADSSLFL